MTTNSKKPPFFIVGCPRSGTTLLQTLLDAHPNITIPPESYIFEHFAKIFHSYGDLRQRSNLYTLVKDILNDERIKQWGLKASTSDFCSGFEDFSVRGVISRLFELFSESEGKRHWGDKTPVHTLYLKEIRSLFPEAKFIHLVRDGRDMAESLTRVWFGRKSIYGSAVLWKKYVNAFREFKRFLEPAEFLEVQYEDLVKNPQFELNRIFEFLNEDKLVVNAANIPMTRRRDFYINIGSHHSSLNQSVSVMKIGIYKKRFSAKEIAIFEAVAGDLLKIYGYEIAGERPVKIAFLEKVYFYLTDRLVRFFQKIIRPSSLKEELQKRSRFLIRWLRKPEAYA